MNIKSILLVASLMVAGTAVAAAPRIDRFPDRMPMRDNAPGADAAMQRAPLNPNKDKGVNVFGFTTRDIETAAHYVDFWTSTPAKLDKINTIAINGASSYDELYRQMRVYVGGWTGDAYYAWRVFMYTFSPGLVDYVKVDTKTGNAEILYTWSGQGNGYGPAWWNWSQALVWNPVTDQAFVLGQNTDGTITSVLKSFDKKTGQYGSIVKTFDTYYFAGAYSMDNEFYGLTWSYDEDGMVTGTVIDVLDVEDNYRRISSNPIKVEGKDWIINYENNMVFDYTTGDLWWSAVQLPKGSETEVVRLVKIDPLSFTTESCGTMGANEAVGGMYIDYVTAQDRRAPAQVKDANFKIDNSGNIKVTLTWTNPSTMWNRRTLNNLSAVEIYRDAYPGTPVATVPATGKEGQAMEWTDDKASNGIHTYYIVPVNEKGKGVPYKYEAFVGKDVPGPVNNVQISTTDGKSLSLTWEKPTRGDNDGWFDDSDLTYTLVRIPDNVTVGTTKETSYTDNTLSDALRYSYEIYASNAQGKGSAAVSESLLAGQGIRAPFYTDFSSKMEADRFSALDLNGDYQTFVYDINNHLMRNTYKFILSNYGNDDVLVSPTLKVEKGHTYKLTYELFYGCLNIAGKEYDVPQPIRIIGGTAPTAEAMKDIHVEDLEHAVDLPSETQKYVAYFTAPVDGDYYVGLELLTKDYADLWLYVEGFRLENAPSDDLDAQAVNAHLYLSTVADNEFNVTVYNNGDKAQDKYTVKLATLNADGTPKVFAETSNVPAIQPHETVIVTMNAKMPFAGVADLVAIVALENDGNDDNDISDPITVQSDETMPINHTAEGDEFTEDYISNLPFTHYFPCTASQTIYTPKMTGLDKIYDGEASITRIAWEGRSLYDMNEFDDTNLKVYISSTDSEGYSSAEAEHFLPVTGQPVFDDLVTLKGGRNYAVVDFEEPFKFDPKKPFMVTVFKEDQKHGDFMFEWRNFDNDWYSRTFHSVTCTSNSPINPSAISGKMSKFPHAPVLHMAVQGPTGIGQIVISDEATVYYNKANSTVEAGFAIATVEVYGTNGQLVERVKVSGGANSAHINAANGICIIKVTGVDGKSVMFKTII